MVYYMTAALIASVVQSYSNVKIMVYYMTAALICFAKER